jgi:hypothetical protein
MEKKLKIGIIGLGQRGRVLMTNILQIDYVQIAAICDLFDDRIEEASKRIVDKGDPKPLETKNYEDVIRSGVEAIIVATGWSNHVKVALAAMKAGVTIAMEVGGTHNIDDCWKLVECYEQTKTPFMFLENCCYNKDEILATSLVRNGVLGEVVYCSGCYGHDLREEIAGGIDTHHYRLEEYKNNNCENYPTHELGPIAKILNINRGNRFVSLVSMSSKAVGMEHYIAKTAKYKDRLGDVKFKQGDVTTTMISCENGETICLKLDTTLPRLYDRGLTVSGTEGCYNQTMQMVVTDDGTINHEEFLCDGKFFKNQNGYEKYLSDDWRVISKEQIEAGHGGMDYVMLKHFFDCVIHKREMPIDVYDAVSWMCVTALSAQSIENGSAPVLFPDFTRGKYKERKSIDVVDIPQVK